MTTPLTGKTVVIMGSSIPATAVDPSTSPPTYLDTLLAAKWGATVINAAIGGAAWVTPPNDPVYGPFSGSALGKAFRDAYAAVPNAWATQDTSATNNPQFAAKLATLKAISWLNVHALIVMLGTNDYGNSRSIGSNTDTGRDTVKGAVSNFLTDMLKTYPHLRILLVTPFYRDRWTASGSGTASLSGTTLTVTAGTVGAANHTLYMEGLERRVTITGQLTSTMPGGALGGTGTYSVSAYLNPGLSSRPFATADADNNGFAYVNSVGTSTAASIAGTTLTVGGTITGVFEVGSTVVGTGVAAGTRIEEILTGSGGAGTYRVSVSQTVSSRAMRAGWTLPEYGDAIEEIAHSPQFNVPVLPAHREAGFNPLTAPRLFTDGLHLSALGLYVCGDIIDQRGAPLLAGVR